MRNSQAFALLAQGGLLRVTRASFALEPCRIALYCTKLLRVYSTTMKQLTLISVFVAVVGGSYLAAGQSASLSEIDSETLVQDVSAVPINQADPGEDVLVTLSAPDNLPDITAISHASAVVEWDGATVFVDPVGEQSQYAPYGTPDIVIITHIHPDHLSVETMIGMLSRQTVVLAPQSVIDEVPLMIANNAIRPFEAGTAQEVLGITFTAVPAYNVRPEAQQYHPRSRGDIGVVMDVEGTRVYFSGDTEGTPEMLALENIDTAFVAMNLPFTMGVDDAARAVATFSPRVVVPYHYRSPNGLSDLDEFERILSELNLAVQVERKAWY